VNIRQIEAEDVDRLERLFYRLSPETVYRRFFSPVHKPNRSTLEHLATVDHADREAMVAVVDDEIIGVARYDRVKDFPNAAEIAVVVEDAWHRHHIATVLLEALTQRAQAQGYSMFTASMLGDNQPIVSLVRALNPKTRVKWDAGTLAAEMPLRRPA
jgi:RimJ/RimL family protein N-acetyltransferase